MIFHWKISLALLLERLKHLWMGALNLLLGSFPFPILEIHFWKLFQRYHNLFKFVYGTEKKLTIVNRFILHFYIITLKFRPYQRAKLWNVNWKWLLIFWQEFEKTMKWGFETRDRYSDVEDHDLHLPYMDRGNLIVDALASAKIGLISYRWLHGKILNFLTHSLT